MHGLHVAEPAESVQKIRDTSEKTNADQRFVTCLIGNKERASVEQEACPLLDSAILTHGSAALR